MDYYTYQRRMEEYNRWCRKDMLRIGGIMLGHYGVLNVSAIIMSLIAALSSMVLNFSQAYLYSADGLMVINILASICGNFIFMGIIWLVNKKKLYVPKKRGRMALILPVCILLIIQINILVSGTGAVISELINFYPNGNVSELISGGNFWIMLVTVGIIGPIIEEFAFRKVIFSMCRKYGFRFAAIISAAMFALMHQNITQFLFAFLIGLVLAYAYEMSGKLIYPIILHVINNAYAVILSCIPISGWVYAGINLLLLIAFAIFAILFLSKKKSFADYFPARGDEAATLRAFFTRPTVIVYMAICLDMAVTTMFISI